MFVVEFTGNNEAHVVPPKGDITRIPQFVFSVASDDDERDECARTYVRKVFQHSGDVAVLH